MEKFRGEAHLPGADHSSVISLEIDWLDRQVNVNIQQPEGGFAEWPGLLAQAIGVEEAAFRTRASRLASLTGGTSPGLVLTISGV
jgi:hypothetical protein